jgi:hypothetical protein
MSMLHYLNVVQATKYRIVYSKKVAPTLLLTTELSLYTGINRQKGADIPNEGADALTLDVGIFQPYNHWHRVAVFPSSPFISDL